MMTLNKRLVFKEAHYDLLFISLAIMSDRERNDWLVWVHHFRIRIIACLNLSISRCELFYRYGRL